VNNVSEHDVQALIRAVVNRGTHRQAISFFADLSQRFSCARKRQPWRALLVEAIRLVAWNLLGDRFSTVLSSSYEHTPNESMLSFPAYAATETLTPS
jgi:hypothetical protein